MSQELMNGGEVISEFDMRTRRWATKALREYILKGFVIDDERLKNPWHFDRAYFDELLERIQEIRISKRNVCQKIADVFEQCSCDYDKNSDIVKEFHSLLLHKLALISTDNKIAEELNQQLYMLIDYAEHMAEADQLMTMMDLWKRSRSFLSIDFSEEDEQT